MLAMIDALEVMWIVVRMRNFLWGSELLALADLFGWLSFASKTLSPC